MKGALAVMVELALARAAATIDLGYVFFGREELAVTESALAGLLEREAGAARGRPRGRHGADGQRHPRRLPGQHQRDVDLPRALGALGAPVAGRQRDPQARPPGSTRWRRCRPTPREFDGLRFTEVVSVTRVAGGIADNVVPAEAVAHVNYRYAPGPQRRRRRGLAARAVRAARHAGHRRQRPQRARGDRQPDGPAADRRRRPGGRAQAGVDARRRVRRRRRRRGQLRPRRPAPRPTRATSTCASTRSCAATRRSRPSHAPEPGPRRHDELPVPAPDRGQARGDRARRRRHRLRRRRAARGDAGLHPASAGAGARGRAGLDLPRRRGPARAARGDRGLDAAALRRGARPRHRGDPHPGLQGGDLPPRPGRGRARRPRRRSPRPAIPWRPAARCSPAREVVDARRSTPRAAGSPTSTPSTGTASRCCG